MSMIRRDATIAADFACRAVGRHHVVRASRFAFNRTHRDVHNDPLTDGELSLHCWIQHSSSLGKQIHIADAGANVGQWTGVVFAAERLDDQVGLEHIASSRSIPRATNWLSGAGDERCSRSSVFRRPIRVQPPVDLRTGLASSPSAAWNLHHGWDHELEIFIEGNYVDCSIGFVQWIPIS